MKISKSPSPIEIGKGVLLGIAFPFIGYYLVQFIFDILTDQGLMDAATSGISSRRMRTICLIAICFNIIPMQFIQRRRSTGLLRGVVLSTIVLAGIWIYYFRSSLY